MDAKKAQVNSLEYQYANTHVKIAPLSGDVTREQEYKAHEETVSCIQEDMAITQRDNPPRRPPQGISEESIELIKAEFAKNRSRIRSSSR
jgi:hypothetical protein